MSKHIQGFIVASFLMVSQVALAAGPSLEVEKCMTPNKAGVQTCFIKGDLGKVGDSVSVYDQNSMWKGTGKITKSVNRSGMMEVKFSETNSQISRGSQVINNSGRDNGALDMSTSFSKSDSTFN